MTAHTRANITVSDPWEFADQNGGRVSFNGDVIAKAGNGHWVLRLDVPVRCDGEDWSYAIPTPRHVGQRYFDERTETDRSANIIFVREEQAHSETWRRKFNSRRN